MHKITAAEPGTTRYFVGSAEDFLTSQETPFPNVVKVKSPEYGTNLWRIYVEDGIYGESLHLIGIVEVRRRCWIAEYWLGDDDSVQVAGGYIRGNQITPKQLCKGIEGIRDEWIETECL